MSKKISGTDPAKNPESDLLLATILAAALNPGIPWRD